MKFWEWEQRLEIPNFRGENKSSIRKFDEDNPWKFSILVARMTAAFLRILPTLFRGWCCYQISKKWKNWVYLYWSRLSCSNWVSEEVKLIGIILDSQVTSIVNLEVKNLRCKTLPWTLFNSRVVIMLVYIRMYIGPKYVS